LSDSRVAKNGGQKLQAITINNRRKVSRTTHRLCEFLDGMYVLQSCSEHEVFLADNREQERGEEGVVEGVDGIRDVFIEQREVVWATSIRDSGVPAIIHCCSTGRSPRECEL
jgi:hypothetical protein